jgi:hypothetical protein
VQLLHDQAALGRETGDEWQAAAAAATATAMVWCCEWIGFRVRRTEEYIYGGGNLGWPSNRLFLRA